MRKSRTELRLRGIDTEHPLIALYKRRVNRSVESIQTTVDLVMKRNALEDPVSINLRRPSEKQVPKLIDNCLIIGVNDCCGVDFFDDCWACDFIS